MTSKCKSIDSYNSDVRVKNYDINMDIMHPNRHKIINVIMKTLQFPTNKPLKIMDLGCGTGIFTQELLSKFPKSKITAIDGSNKMITLAKSRLKNFLGNINFIVENFNNIDKMFSTNQNFDLIISLYSLHHLDKTNKLKVIKRCRELLKKHGWFFNADIIIAETNHTENLFQKFRINEIIKTNNGKSKKFNNQSSTSKFLKKMEKEEGDKPLKLSDELKILKKAGLINIDIFWKEYREIVIGGCKT